MAIFHYLCLEASFLEVRVPLYDLPVLAAGRQNGSVLHGTQAEHPALMHARHRLADLGGPW